MRAATRPSTYGTAGRCPSMYITKLLGQSSAAHTSTVGTNPLVSARSRGYSTGAANSSCSPTRPGCTRNPSPGARSGPHTKQPGKGCHSGCTMTGDAAAAARASSNDGGAGTSMSTDVATASAIVASPSRRRSVSSAAASTLSGVSSGAGSRNVTSAVPSKWTASIPAVTPPFPRSGGPANRAGITTVSMTIG